MSVYYEYSCQHSFPYHSFLSNIFISYKDWSIVYCECLSLSIFTHNVILMAKLKSE